MTVLICVPEAKAVAAAVIVFDPAALNQTYAVVAEVVSIMLIEVMLLLHALLEKNKAFGPDRLTVVTPEVNGVVAPI